MPLIETIKERVEKITGWGRPTRRDVEAALRPRKPNVFRFTDDGLIPNNGKLPLIFYRGGVRTADVPDPAALFEVLFESNGWKSSWRDGIFDYVHYHSQIHEVLGIGHGHAMVRFGGSRGRVLKLKAGDVAILPAGTGHERLDKGLRHRQEAATGVTYRSSADEYPFYGTRTAGHLFSSMFKLSGQRQR